MSSYLVLDFPLPAFRPVPSLLSLPDWVNAVLFSTITGLPDVRFSLVPALVFRHDFLQVDLSSFFFFLSSAPAQVY